MYERGRSIEGAWHLALLHTPFPQINLPLAKAGLSHLLTPGLVSRDRAEAGLSLLTHTWPSNLERDRAEAELFSSSHLGNLVRDSRGWAVAPFTPDLVI
jgi:hypothetical protein